MHADSSSDLPMLEAVGFPVAVNPEPRLASIARKRGWLVEDFGSDFGQRCSPRWVRPGGNDAPAGGSREGAALRATSSASGAAARLGSAARGGVEVGPLELVTDDEQPDLPGPDWVRLSPRLAGICGSDPATVDGRSSTVVRADRRSRSCLATRSSPTRPRRSTAATTDATTDATADGAPPGWCSNQCSAASPGDLAGVSLACAGGPAITASTWAHGDVDAGLQTGYCCDTGGGWSTSDGGAPQPTAIAVPGTT